MNWRFWDRTGGAGCDGCTAIEPLLSLYSDGMASPAEVRRVEAHLADCDGCRQSLGWMRATRQVIAARPTVPPPTDLRARIARAIAEADGLPAPVRAPRPVRRPLALRPALAYGLSFALLATLSGSLIWNADRHAASPLISAHQAPRPVVVATNPGGTLPQLRPRVHPQARPAPAPAPLVATVPDVPNSPDSVNSNVPVPHIPRLPFVRLHPDLPQPADLRGLADVGLSGTVTGVHKHTPTLHPGTKFPMTLPVYHAAPHSTKPLPGDTVLANRPPKTDPDTPRKQSPIMPPPTLEATRLPDVTPEPTVMPHVTIQTPTVTPDVRVEIHTASLGETLRDTVRSMHEMPLTSRSFKLSSSVVEAAGVSSDRSGTLAAVGAGFGGH